MHHSGSLLLLTVLASSIAGEELPLAVVPADALVVVQVRGLDRVGERLVRLTREASEQRESSIPDLAEALIRSLGFGVRLEGLAATGPAFPGPADRPRPDAVVHAAGLHRAGR